MAFFTIIGIILIIYYLFYLFTLCLVDSDVRLVIAEKFGKKLGELNGKVIWITGASSGIGEALACQAAKYKVKLVISARREGELQRVKNKCLQINPELSPDDILILPLDITKTNLHKTYFDLVINQFKKLDILINNAGRSQRAIWENVDVEVDRQVFDLNVFGVISLSRLAIQYFNKNKTGQIAVTSSLAGIVGAPYSCSYTGSKHAIHGYFESLRNEKLGTPLQITLLCPGPVFSNFLQESFTENPGEKYGESVDKNDKRMTPERCAELSLIAIVNKLDEAWMGRFPLMLFVYALVYFPNISKQISKIIGPRQFQKLRDSKLTVSVQS
ncbi:alcohol dehydrogenase, putative [Pediculus humanus corporis]|uniref:Alcohol dehydrogenase, putative n=1 Tax=Pediculus humanus subsp. corporis TaxID=121224 RepID=E0VWT0_PEDHC|nr:alcohol dehydrogenase, putative [Pediculus humanus corporis]EEB17836.1 alcohol dehydrogenase, putative [Pediculus humanus corporis]